MKTELNMKEMNLVNGGEEILNVRDLMVNHIVFPIFPKPDPEPDKEPGFFIEILGR